MRAVATAGRVIAVLLIVSVAGCGSAVPRQAVAGAHSGYPTELLAAERVDALFAGMPEQVAVAVAAIALVRDPPPADIVQALQASARRSFAAERATLSAAMAQAEAPADNAELARCLSALDRARTAIGSRVPSAGEMDLLGKKFAARPDTGEIRALPSLMAQPRLAGEQAITALRTKLVLDELRGRVTPTIVDEMLKAIPQLITGSRQDQGTEQLPGLNAQRVMEGTRGTLSQALLALPPADVAVLTRWYASPKGRATTARLVNAFQAANDRAGQAMLVDFLQRVGESTSVRAK